MKYHRGGDLRREGSRAGLQIKRIKNAFETSIKEHLERQPRIAGHLRRGNEEMEIIKSPEIYVRRVGRHFIYFAQLFAINAFSAGSGNVTLRK